MQEDEPVFTKSPRPTTGTELYFSPSPSLVSFYHISHPWVTSPAVVTLAVSSLLLFSLMYVLRSYHSSLAPVPVLRASAARKRARSSSRPPSVLGECVNTFLLALWSLADEGSSDRTTTNFFEGSPLSALTTLSFSDNVDLQRSAALAFAEITEKEVQAVKRDTLDPILFLLSSHDTEVQRAASAALGNLAVNSTSKSTVAFRLGVHRCRVTLL